MINISSQKDTNHIQRRQQQRAINENMIQISLLYGRKQYNRGAVIYTLSGRILEKTPYAKFSDIWSPPIKGYKTKTLIYF